MPSAVSGGFVRINPGDPLPSKASAWNRVADAVDFAESRRKLGGTVGSEDRLLTNELPVKNDRSRRIERGQTLTLHAPVNTDGELPRFRDRGRFYGGDAVADPDQWGKSCIARRSIEPAAFGDCLAGATQPCQLRMRHDGSVDETWMDFADIDLTGANPDILVAHASGSWQILYHDLNTRSVGDNLGWAIVRYTGPQQRELKAKTKVAMSRGSSAYVSVYKGDAIVGELPAYYDWGGTTVLPAGTEIYIKWFIDELQWVIIAKDVPDLSSMEFVQVTGNHECTEEDMSTKCVWPGVLCGVFEDDDVVGDPCNLFWAGPKIWITVSNVCDYGDEPNQILSIRPGERFIGKRAGTFAVKDDTRDLYVIRNPDIGKVRVNKNDELDFLEDQWKDHGPDTYNEGDLLARETTVDQNDDPKLRAYVDVQNFRQLTQGLTHPEGADTPTWKDIVRIAVVVDTRLRGTKLEKRYFAVKVFWDDDCGDLGWFEAFPSTVCEDVSE